MEGALKCPDNTSSLQYDTACLQIHNDMNNSITLYSVSSECVGCDPVAWSSVANHELASLVVSAVHSLDVIAVNQQNNQTICQQTLSLSQHEVVSWTVNEYNCTVSVMERGEDAFVPLYVLVCSVAGLFLLKAITRALISLGCHRKLRHLFSHNSASREMENDLGNPSSSTDSLPLVQSELVPLRRLNRPRILSLDTFRGITIALMIFVNYGGGKYWFFEHSAWNGLTVADLVFPWFAWVMGVSLVLSYRSRLRSCASRWHVLRTALQRAVSLVALGLLVNAHGHTDYATLRFCGVLQRLGLAYLIVSTLEIFFMKKQPSFQRGCFLPVSELADSWRQWLVIIVLAVIQIVGSLYLTVPGCPTGYLGPGGAANHSQQRLCTGGAARYIDSQVFGDSHLYSRGVVRRVYHTAVPNDPEGLLGTLTTCLTVYLGVQAGYIILSYNSTVQRSARWLFWALVTGVTAGFLCGWTWDGDDGLIPINKQLWSVSFALLTSSTAFILFTVLFITVDHFNWWFGDPFRYAGMNAILLYLGHIVTAKSLPWTWQPHNLSSHYELLAMNTIAVGLWLAVALILTHNQIFLTL